jgi:biotin carboxylase
MPEPGVRPLNIICLATYFKGADFIRECKTQGCRVFLITKEKMLNEDWPRESLEDLIALPNDAGPLLFIDLVAFLSRKAKADRIVALEEFDVVTAALVREHFGMPGLSSSKARVFRDKFAMAVQSKRAGIDAPDSVPLINPDEVREFMERIPSPWLIKPRSDVSAIGIRKVEDPSEVWSVIDELNGRENLNERASYYLLARFVSGDVFHVDSIVNHGRVVFTGVNHYGRPPMQVAHHGGAYISHTVARDSADEKELHEINRKLLQALGLERGATHAEFIKSTDDGKFYFIEVASRVGGAYIADVLEAASGINLWREWAKIEISEGEEGKTIQSLRDEYAGIVLSLAKQEYPDTRSYIDSEIVYRIKKRHHVGMIVRSPKLSRVTELLDEYSLRFAEDFVAIVPPPERPE